jgi:hypothetical protein
VPVCGKEGFAPFGHGPAVAEVRDFGPFSNGPAVDRGSRSQVLVLVQSKRKGISASPSGSIATRSLLERSLVAGISYISAAFSRQPNFCRVCVPRPCCRVPRELGEPFNLLILHHFLPQWALQCAAASMLARSRSELQSRSVSAAKRQATGLPNRPITGRLHREVPNRTHPGPPLCSLRLIDGD